MSVLEFFKRRKQAKKDKRVQIRRFSKNQRLVYNALVTFKRPANARMIAQRLRWDTDSVTPRLSEMHQKGFVSLCDRKQGLDGRWRNFYLPKGEA